MNYTYSLELAPKRREKNDVFSDVACSVVCVSIGVKELLLFRKVLNESLQM